MPSGVFLEKTPPFTELRRAREFWNRSRANGSLIIGLSVCTDCNDAQYPTQTGPSSPSEKPLPRRPRSINRVPFTGKPSLPDTKRPGLEPSGPLVVMPLVLSAQPAHYLN